METVYVAHTEEFLKDVSIPKDYKDRLDMFESFPYLAVVHLKNLLNGTSMLVQRVPGGWTVEIGRRFRLDLTTGSKDLMRVAGFTSSTFKNERQQHRRKNPTHHEPVPCPAPARCFALDPQVNEEIRAQINSGRVARLHMSEKARRLVS